MYDHVTDPSAGHLPHDVITSIRDVYEPAGMVVTDAARRETESAEYGACRFGLDGRLVVFRVAKTTPTKLGQFVTMWKRATPESEIAPLDVLDGVAFVVVSVFDTGRRGQFVFSQRVLADQGVLSRGGAGGKRAIRVYPPWVTLAAKEAIRTQRWQLTCFLPQGPNGAADPVLVRKRFQA
ncbi:MAG: MepB family protein [Kofleriaceae bacterium]